MQESEKWKWSRSVVSDSYQASPSMGFSRQEYWSGVPLPYITNTMPVFMYYIRLFAKYFIWVSSVSSVAQSYSTLCDSMDCSMPGFLVHNQFLELPQTQVHRVGDAIQPSHPLLSPSLSASNDPQHHSLVFSSASTLPIRWPNYWSFSFSISPSNEYSGLICFRIDSLISLQSKGLSRLFSNTTASIIWLSAFFIFQLSYPYMTTGKKYSFD